MKLLLVEDNTGLREQMKWALNDVYTILEADGASSCFEVFDAEHPDLVCLDMGLDNIPEKGLEIINPLLLKNPSAKIIVITAQTSETLGQRSIEKGAFDYLRKPVEIDELKVILARATRMLELEIPLQRDFKGGMESAPNYFMVGDSPAMKKIFETINRLAKTDVNVLITGESGTGKELCARAIHYHSSRTTQPFVPINCGAIPETLLESELFGYVKGAFTGATMDKKGLIESANNGTFFLDEIGDMPKHLQVKLLRFLEERKFQRLGDVSLQQADVRIIAATNRKDISAENNAMLRTDLYFRLSEFEINLPRLVERGDDILLLADKIIARNRIKFALPKLKLSSRARQCLLGYGWPGNVRELENKLSRASITCNNQTIEPDNLQLPTESMKNLSLPEAKDIFEKEFIGNAILQAQNNISEAAKRLGISRPTLYDLIKKHRLPASKEKQGGSE
jgi:two-component system, NtrC family, response regulator